MNMSASNKNMILVLLGIIALVLAYLLGFSPMMEEKKQIDNEVTQLQAHYNELLQKVEHQAEYEEGTVVYNDRYDQKLAQFPATLDQEYTVEFIEGIRQAYDFDTKALGLGEPEQFYILGASAAPADGSAEATADDTQAAEETTDTTVQAEPVITDDSLVCNTAQFAINYEGSYEGIKEMLNYVAGYKYRMTVDTTQITYDPSADLYSGTVTLTCYCISGQGRTDEPLNLDIDTGVSNIFTGNGSAGGATSGLTKYDENDGAAIASDYDFYVMLNPSGSDVSPKVVGQKGKDASQISSDSTDEEALKLDFYEKDGKNYVTYTIGTESYEAEVTSPDDVTVYVTSTERTGADDKSAVKVTISNTMSIPVYVKVSGDDATSPRFNVTSKTGQVKVYK